MTPAARLRPDRVLEHTLLADSTLVGGVDEVGRGALAGVVTVGVAVVCRDTPDAFPERLADSKQLSPPARRALVGPLHQWLADYAVAHSCPAEIDAYGIVGALHLAGARALGRLAARGHAPQALILDGACDWLSAPQQDLLTSLGASGSCHAPRGDPRQELALSPPETDCPTAPGAGPAARVHLQVKADARCAVVAAASVLAKVERDALMTQLEDPGYGWASNKGYASAAHVAALSRLGASDHHRRSWRLPGLTGRST